MIKEAISTLVAGEDLTPETMKQVMEEIMTGEATDAQKASFLTALAIKGETIEEITEAAKVMRSHCAPFDNDMDTLEIVGTGGDRSNTINISTLAALITSAAGIKTTKHGNRAASSKCGTADCLEALGVKIDGDAEESLQSLRDNNFCSYLRRNIIRQCALLVQFAARSVSAQCLIFWDRLQIRQKLICS